MIPHDRVEKEYYRFKVRGLFVLLALLGEIGIVVLLVKFSDGLEKWLVAILATLYQMVFLILFGRTTKVIDDLVAFLRFYREHEGKGIAELIERTDHLMDQFDANPTAIDQFPKTSESDDPF